MKVIALVPAVLAAAVFLLAAPASAAPANLGFGFIATDIAGTQNAWIQGVGCASAIANFSS